MLVKDVIERLLQMPPEATAVIYDADGSCYRTVDTVEKIQNAVVDERLWYGSSPATHEEPAGGFPTLVCISGE